MDAWLPLAQTLRDQPPESLATPEGGRLGAALVLLADLDRDGDLEVVYTRRREDLPTHPGQISFPGGRVEPGETVEQAAVREAAEEVGLVPGSVDVLGRLPAFYIPPSRYWLQPVVARWRAPHRLAAAEAEVAEVLRVRLSTLRDPAVWRVVRLPSTRGTWAWQLDERHLLWGATAMVTAQLLAMVDPRWHGGADPAALPADREARPWETSPRHTLRPGRALLHGVEERAVATGATTSGGPPAPLPDIATAAAAGRAVAAAVERMHEPVRSAPLLVLAGGGGNGAAGLFAARRLRGDGWEVRVVLDRRPDRLRSLPAQALAGLRDVAAPFDGALPAAGLVVDALVGGGLSGTLSGVARDIVLALRHQQRPVLAVDVPSGLDPSAGLVGECVPADVTVALAAPRPGLLLPGLGPLVGDLYLAGLRDGEDLLVRLVGAPPGVDAVVRHP